MVIEIKNHSYSYDIENIAEIFFPYEKIKMIENGSAPEDNIRVVTEICGNTATVDAVVYDKQLKDSVIIKEESDGKSELSVLFYSVLSRLLGIEYPWGILYGVRPARFMHSLTDRFGEDTARSVFKNQYLVTDEKINLNYRSFKTRKFFALRVNTVLPHKVLLLLLRVAQYREYTQADR